MPMRASPTVFLVILSLLLGVPASVRAATFSVAGVRMNKQVKPMREIKRENVVMQTMDFSCGAAGLSTLLNYYLEEPVAEVEIINSLLQTVPLEKVLTRKGFSLLDLKNFAQTKGYKVTGYKMDLAYLRSLKKPVLVPVVFRKYRHFVIVRGVVGDRVFVADPATGNMSMKLGQFEKMWNTGIGLVVERAETSENDFALKVKEDDLLFADYKMMSRLIDQTAFRTAIFPGEY